MVARLEEAAANGLVPPAAATPTTPTPAAAAPAPARDPSPEAEQLSVAQLRQRALAAAEADAKAAAEGEGDQEGPATPGGGGGADGTPREGTPPPLRWCKKCKVAFQSAKCPGNHPNVSRQAPFDEHCSCG